MILAQPDADTVPDIYDDELVRLSEGWRFSKRRLVSRSIARADVPIEKVHPLSAHRPSFA